MLRLRKTAGIKRSTAAIALLTLVALAVACGSDPQSGSGGNDVSSQPTVATSTAATAPTSGLPAATVTSSPDHGLMTDPEPTATAVPGSTAVPVASPDPSATISPNATQQPDTTPAPQPTSTATPLPAPSGPIAPDFTLPSATGGSVTLSELTSQKPVVVVFYRAFW